MDATSSSSPALATQEHITLNQLVTRMHAAYISLPDELCPPSRPSSPTSEERVAATKGRIMDLVNLAGGDPTNPKWGYVTRTATLACTARKYVGVGAGVRVGDGREVRVGKKFKWDAIPANEEEWEAHEQRWKAAVAEEEQRKKSKAKTVSTASKTSKYWQKPVTEPEEPSRPNSKAEVIREKVARWQAEVVTITTVQDVPMSQETGDSSQLLSGEKGKGRAQSSVGEKVQASLAFPVVKRSSATSAKGGSSASSKPRPSPAACAPTPRADTAAPPSTDKHQEAVPSNASDPTKGVREPAIVARISEVPDFSFLPPSFPSQLQTSTPPPNDRRHKPYPIVPCSPPPSSPFSSTSFDPSQPRRRGPQQASSSQHGVSPMHKQSKRVRSPNTTLDDGRMDVSPQPSPSAQAPVNKKTRVNLSPQSTEQEPVSSPIPVPPSTPPPTSPLPVAPVTPVSRGKGLGNARGLPVPTTPDPHPLPTLTDLLASSRRSKPRPRPPSRKNTPQSRASAKSKDKYPGHADASELPTLAESGHESASEGEDASPTKTYFSSPASGASDSPMSIAHRPRSPISPLFTSAFVPRFTSSQRPQAGVGGDDSESLSQPHGGLMRGSSGFFEMGYSSQFDVEGHVGQVSELLERDVDLNGWLRDMGTEDEDDVMLAVTKTATLGTQDALDADLEDVEVD